VLAAVGAAGSGAAVGGRPAGFAVEGLAGGEDERAGSVEAEATGAGGDSGWGKKSGNVERGAWRAKLVLK